jgi:hypothetical protein
MSSGLRTKAYYLQEGQQIPQSQPVTELSLGVNAEAFSLHRTVMSLTMSK